MDMSDYVAGIFKIEDSVRVAKLWGERKNRPQMNYDKLSRSIRQYYKKGIIKKTVNSKRLVYQFCPAYMQWNSSSVPQPWDIIHFVLLQTVWFKLLIFFQLQL